MLKRVADLYALPFQFVHGYIQDNDHRMVADQHDGPDSLRVRGWGRISYMEDPENLQDAVGTEIAKAVTAHWEMLKQPLYTCKGKGGRYRLLGSAIGAGEGDLKGTPDQLIYQDVETGQLFRRTHSWTDRMELVDDRDDD
jgi:hypothetical protein